MNKLSLITRIYGVVDRNLKRKFPDDYDRRCMYAAFGVFELLKDAGIISHVIGGDFLAFVVAANGQRAGLQGFGAADNETSHFWVECDDAILDLGPHYLPRGSSFLASKLPFIAWQPASQLPRYLRYRVGIRYDPKVQLAWTPEINQRMETFIADCRARYAVQKGQPSLSSWILTDQRSLVDAAKRGDAWANSAIRFAGMNTPLPF